MRYLVLDDSIDHSLSDFLRLKLGEEEFLATGNLFLSALAVIDEEGVEQIRSRLLPHKLQFNARFSSGFNFQGNANSPIPDQTVPLSNERETEKSLIGMGMRNPWAPPNMTITSNHERELFQKYTTLEDSSPSTDRSSSRSSVCDIAQDRVMSNYEELNISQSPSLMSEIHGYTERHTDPASQDQVSSQPSIRSNSVGSNQVSPKSIASMHLPSTCSVLRGSGNWSRLPTCSASPGSNTSRHSAQRSMFESPTAAPEPPDVLVNENDFTECEADHSSLGSRPSSRGLLHGDTPYIRAFNALTTRYGGNTKNALTTSKIITVIQVGDSLLREDAANFISFHLSKEQINLWCQFLVPNPISRGPLAEKLLKSFHCAEILEQRYAVDSIRLRVARILLY